MEKRIKQIQRPLGSLNLAYSTWAPTKKEEDALSAHHYVHDIRRVDQIWPWLKHHHGKILAVNSPHSLPPEKYTYEELADCISIAATAFHSLGVVPGDVVALFSENNPRWLIADQGLMRLGASNAVRGATAPVEELRYILDNSSSVGLIIQSAKLWEEINLGEDERKKFKFVLQLEGDPKDNLIGWDEFIEKGLKGSSIDFSGSLSSVHQMLQKILYLTKQN